MQLLHFMLISRAMGDAIRTRCHDEAPAHLRDGGLFRDGVDAVLDECRSLQRDGAQWLADYQAQLVQDTGIPSLKVGYNRVFGYYIEVTHVHTAAVGPSFVRKQTLKNAERYITDELKTYETKVMSAEAKATAREQSMFAALIADIMGGVERIDVTCPVHRFTRRAACVLRISPPVEIGQDPT